MQSVRTVARPFRLDHRAPAAAVALLVNVAIGYLLLSGLALHWTRHKERAPALFDLTPAPSPIPPAAKPAQPRRSHRPQGTAAPPNLRATPTRITAPAPVIPLPSPVIAAPIAGTGSASSAGAADIAGPATGAGGEGSGGDGYGDGEGDGTPPRLRSGRLKNSDYPRAAGEAGIGGTVGVRYMVWTDGRVQDCRVTASSGNADLDATTCRLIRERFRFRPARDPDGTSVPSIIVENHSWIIERDVSEPAAQ